MSKKPRIYMAGPLFTTAERAFNVNLRNVLHRLRPDFEFVLPQERAEKILPDVPGVVADCLQQVGQANLVLACLDGPDADSGTCVEVGYALALRKKVLGFRTDFRGSEADGVNAMLRHGCTDYIRAPSYEVPFDALVARLVEVMDRLLR